MKTAHILQHVAFEGPGSIRTWLDQQGFRITTTHLYQDETLPDINQIDFLIIMGGPMSVNDEADYPWLAKEKQFIRRAVDMQLPVLGICLGAQLIAAAFGARVYANHCKEIGWFPVRPIANKNGCFVFPDKSMVFHWHGETFDLPDNAVLLASSNACTHQAFQIGSCAIGLQFHLETTAESVAAMVDNCRHELVNGDYIQNEQDMLAAAPQYCLQANRLMESLLTYLWNRPTCS